MLVSLLIAAASLTVSNAVNCCRIHVSSATCAAEAGQSCTWLSSSDPRLGAQKRSPPTQCISERSADCLQKVVDSGDNRRIACSITVDVADLDEYSHSELSARLNPPIVTDVRTCAFEPCTNDNYEYNVQYIFDESGSVGATNYDSSVDFVEALIANDVNAVSPISVLSFGSIVDTLYRFTDDQSSRTSVLATVDNAKSHYVPGWTYTLDALEAGVSLFESETNAGETNFIFLITDGIPSTATSSTAQNPCYAGNSAILDRIKAAGIQVYVMGIGSFNADTLSCLTTIDAANPGDTFTVSGFTSEDFSKLEEQARPITCPAPNTPLDTVLAALYHPYSSFVSASFYVKALIVMLVAAVLYKSYRYYVSRNNGGYKLLPTVEAPYGSMQNV